MSATYHARAFVLLVAALFSASGCVTPGSDPLGRDRSPITIFPVTIDATGVSATRLNVLGSSYNGPNVVTTLQLAPNTYELCIPTSNNCFPFTVDANGLVGFDPSLDRYVSGRGTSTVTVTGSPITIDATAVSVTRFNVDFGDVGQGPNVATTYALIPGVYRLCVPASNNCFLFDVGATGLLDFDPGLDGYVSGRGTTVLTVVGYPITVDATAVAAATTFNVDFGVVGSGPNEVTTYELVPGDYVLCVPASNNCFDFSVTFAGTVDYAASLDSRVEGRGTSTIVVGARPPTVTCVGSASAPAQITIPPNTCGVAVDTSDAGSCKSGDARPVACTFDGASSEVLGPGTHAITVTATGAGGATATCISYLMVVDSIPPIVSTTPSPAQLWPPNHKLIPVDLHLVASDNCGLAAPPTCDATSDEAPLGSGFGHSDPDIVWSGGQLFLRAERSGTGPGRTYTITCTATDTSGNTSVASGSVEVPHSAP